MDEFKALLENQSLNELIVTGFIDSGSGIADERKPHRGFGQFHALWDEVYLEIGQTLLRVGALENDPQLRVERVERIECSVDVDPDDTFGVMCMLRALLPSGRDSVRVERIDVYTGEGDAPESGVVTALGLALDKGEYLFFDPLDLANGMHVGTAKSRELWLTWVGERYRLTSYVVGA